MSKSSRRDLPPPPLPFDSPSSLRRTGAAAKSATKPPATPTNSLRVHIKPSAMNTTHQGRYCILATSRDGDTYPGDMIKDTISYRILRADSLHQELSSKSAAELARLETSLRQSPPKDEDNANDSAKLRSFQRYNCHYLSAIHYHDSEDHNTILSMPVIIGDISAGGVKICGPHSFEPGLAVVLHIRDTGPECNEVQLPSRIAWTTDSAFGLMFAGPPKIVGTCQRKDLAA